ncbi:MAG TPA: hypothetical protein PKK06_11450 [Phycisphaerae bacterium]|nr:hypothetical protein [Phycisphaerae bacterium]HNU45856.1 hypothetical protein [Phycisphaerae bacterium]
MVSSTIDTYPNTFAVVEYHQQDAYAVAWGEARGNFYNIWADGIPWFAYDGLWDAWPISTYVSKFVARQAVPTPVTLRVGAEQVSGLMYQITIRACLEPGATSRTVRLYAVVVQDYYPSSPSYSRNTFRVATNTADVGLRPGECVVDTRTVTLNSGWTYSNLRIIAWAQQPLSAGPAEVYQAAKDHPPFDGLPVTGDYNMDGPIDLDDAADFVACLSGPNASPGPSLVCRTAFDFDDDNDIDLEDFATFQEAFTGS